MAPFLGGDPYQDIQSQAEPITDELCRVMLSTRWRRSTADTELRADIRRKVDQRVRQSAPIEFSVPFGGYKAWHQASAPLPNWAEIMWISHLRNFASALASAYAPGVVVTFTYHSQVIDLVTNTHPNDQAAYIASLAEIMGHFSCQAITFRLVDLVELETSADVLRSRILDTAAAMPVTESDDVVRRAYRNLERGGLHDLTNIGDEELVNEAIRRARICQALECTPARRQYNKFEHRIQLSHIRGPHLALHIGSSRSSTHQPWVGTGFLTATRRQSIVDTIRNGGIDPTEAGSAGTFWNGAFGAGPSTPLSHAFLGRAAATVDHGLLPDPGIDVLGPITPSERKHTSGH